MTPPGEIPIEKIEELLDGAYRADDSTRANGASPAPIRPPGAECPPQDHWFKVAAGELNQTEALLHIDHAAECETCGPLLSYWAMILSTAESPDESTILPHLASARSGWQERMAKSLTRHQTPSGRSLFSRRYFLPVSLGFAGALAAALLFLLLPKGFRQQAAPERLLADAYTSQRLMEARIPLAAYAPVAASHRQRAAGRSTMNDSVPLLEARAAITQALMKSPEDRHWLLLEARADLLSGNYDPAIDTLKRILALDPSNIEALTDIASAYTLRARSTDVISDEATALDYLEQAALRDPGNAVVLYNEAVILQDLCQLTEAMDVWNKFLAAEHDRQWIEDGKRRLVAAQELEEHCRKQQSRLSPLLATPEGMLHLARSPALLADSDEELSTIHLPLLLKTAFPQNPPSSSVSSPSTSLNSTCFAACIAARTLLHALAASLQKNHQDDWLADMLSTPPTARFASSVNLLGSAMDADSHGDVNKGEKFNDAALTGFRQIHNAGGEIRSRTQQIYEFQRLLFIRPCRDAATNLAPVLAHRRYPWMQAQVTLNNATCEGAQNDMTAAIANVNAALLLSNATHYRIVYLRALGFLAGEEYLVGKHNLAWNLNIEGLRRFWEGDYPMDRANQFLSNLVYQEKPTSRVYSAVLFDRELLHLTTEMIHPEITAIDQFLLIRAEILAGETKDAAAQLQTAEEETAAIPSLTVQHRYYSGSHLELAEAYIARSDRESARRMLLKSSQYIAGLHIIDDVMPYDQAMGELALLDGDNRRAELYLSRAVSIAEGGFQHLRRQEERAAWFRSTREIYAAITLLRLREGVPPIEALALWERYRIMSSGIDLSHWCHNSDLACLAPPLEALEKSLKDETILGSLRLGRTLVLWTMDDRGVQTHELEIAPQHFDLLNRTFAEMAATPQSREESLRFFGYRVAASLLRPVASTLDPRRTLILDMDDTMEFLPVAALPFNSGYLGTQFAVTTVHSPLLANRSPRSEAHLSSGLVIGASVPGDPEASPLPEARTEALAVAAFLDRPKVLVDSAAVSGAVENAIAGAPLIHFAGHAMSYSGQTRLMLARDPASHRSDSLAPTHMPQTEWLDTLSFRPSALTECRLVVLSACSTGKREERDFDGFDEIVDTLAADGVPDIVATHWDVDSEASVALMKNFYSGLARGLTAPQALSQAEAAVSRLEPYHHPYYWAAYYTAGMGTSNLKEVVHD
jgi:CHAT domain-containing protein/tetratricopeptide (TPR) repeat protein